MQKIVLFFFWCISLNTYSAEYLKVLYIADHDSICGTKSCLLARDSPSDSYQIFDKTIEGFTYTTGYEYCLLVEIQTSGVSEPATAENAPLERYVLSEIRSKTKTGNRSDSKVYSSSIPDSSKWMLYKMRLKDGSTKTFSIPKAYLQFDIINNTVIGNTECNSLHAEISIDSNMLKFDNIVTTKMACGKHSIEPIFLNMLHSATNYKFTSKLLYVYKGKMLIALFTRKK